MTDVIDEVRALRAVLGVLTTDPVMMGQLEDDLLNDARGYPVAVWEVVLRMANILASDWVEKFTAPGAAFALREGIDQIART
ncbi:MULTISPECIES: hypothetical protein [unclassified Leifsonia]|uniref:hypothetical protein n=1 Tax=unclassified Leifsonia TaxID=2663824 RepID=UPI0006FAB1C0|nr:MULTISPECIES: hypothetical protein [unclassified Leifsonia]KQX07205.1 hypothetical protein ASC59_05255 [Leifsonia sp. Root1293]KRA11488.1 hypothetical protein ASD61_05255 [Leifsonia sp. Root60]